MSFRNNTAMQILKDSPYQPQGPVGKAPAKWANNIEHGKAGELNLSGEPVDRAYLRRLARQNVRPEEFFLSVMAWGGMRADHGRDAWRDRARWLPPLELALNGIASRGELYRKFNECNIRGLKPAFFTKLIYFAGREENGPLGYIMDQWTAKSVNLIFEKTVDVWPSGWVTPSNDHSAYEGFCQRVEEIALDLGVSGSEAEERLFSRGGLNPGVWRKYVIKETAARALKK